MWALMIAFWGLLIWAGLRLDHHTSPASPAWGPAGEARRRILDERLARGEIDTDQYRRLRDAMTQEGSRSKAPAGSG